MYSDTCIMLLAWNKYYTQGKIKLFIITLKLKQLNKKNREDYLTPVGKTIPMSIMQQ